MSASRAAEPAPNVTTTCEPPSLTWSSWASTTTPPPAAVHSIQQISKTGTIQPWPNSTSSIVTGTSILNPLLVNGAQYWLRISVPNPVNDALVWMRSTNQQGSLTYGRSNSFDWAMVSGGEMAFRITSDVPEPGALGMTGIALCAIGMMAQAWLTPLRAATGCVDWLAPGHRLACACPDVARAASSTSLREGIITAQLPPAPIDIKVSRGASGQVIAEDAGGPLR